MPNHRQRKIGAVRKLFEQREQVATSQLVTALARLKNERGKDEDMQAFLSEYRGRYETGASSGMPSAQARIVPHFGSIHHKLRRGMRLRLSNDGVPVFTQVTGKRVVECFTTLSLSAPAPAG